MKLRPVGLWCFWTLAAFLLIGAAQLAIAQPPGQRPVTPKDADAACATCCGGTMVLVLGSIAAAVLGLVINVAILFWVAKDAKSRGMDGAIWIFLILFTGLLGLAIYLFSRPQGDLIQCANCGNNRMRASVKCPHCGEKSGSSRRSRSRDDDDDDD